MQSRKIIPILLIAVLAVLGYAILRNQDAADIAPDIARGNGRIEAVQIDIATKIPGRVESILVREGDLVETGQLLATIDTAQLQAQLLRARAYVASAESEVASARASIAQAEAQRVLADQELKRAEELVHKGHTSKERYDTRVSELAVANANLEAANAMLIARQRNVDAAQANAVEIQTQIDDARLVAPTTGRVLYRLAEPGEVLGVGGKVLTLVNLADVYMEVFLPSAQAHRVAIGAEARVKLDVLDYAIPAQVSFVSPESQFTPKQVETPSERDKLMFRVKARIPQELVLEYIDRVKTGVRGVAYIRLSNPPGETASPWPEFLQHFPPGAAATATEGN